MANCPVKSLQDWNTLVDKVGVQKAYMIFIKNGNKVPYLQSRESNRMVWDIENAKGLVTWEKVGNTNVKRYKGFDRDSAQTIIENIRNEYVGDYIIKRISPDTKGEFGIKIEGFPIDRKLWDEYIDSVEEDKRNYADFKQAQEFKARMIEANEFIIPPDTDISTFDTGYEQRLTIIKEGVDVVFESNPELVNIGTKQQYSQYLSTIFPDSKFKDIVYHVGSNPSIGKFDKAYIGGGEGTSALGKGFYFGGNLIDQAVQVGYDEAARESIQFNEPLDAPWLSAILNINNPYYENGEIRYSNSGDISKIGSSDSIISSGEYVVFESEQIHILGSRQDIEGFIKFVNKQGYDQEPRYYSEVISKTEFEKQKNLLSAIMPQVEDIVEDRSLTVVGKLEAGGKRIIVNPDKITKDTLGHEYGHLLIDLRGGMQDPFIRKGVEQLKGSEIEKHVARLYPELIGTERFYKEVMAEAIGREVGVLFEKESDVNKFAEWLLRFFRWLNTRLGISRNNAKVLARQLVGKDSLDTSTFEGVPSSYIQEQRIDGDITDAEVDEAIRREGVVEVENAVLSEIELIRNKAEDLLATRVRTLNHRGNVGDIKRLEESLEVLRDTTIDNNRAILAFADNTVKYIDRVYNTYKELKAKEASGKLDAFNIRMLERWYDILSGYDVLDDIAALVMSTGNTLPASTTRKLLDRLNEAIVKKNVVRDLYTTKGIDLLSKELSKYSTLVRAQTREIKQSEYIALPKEAKRTVTMDKYVDDYLDKNEVDITKKSIAMLAKEMQVASSDITYLQRWLDTILDSNDMVMAAVVKKIVIADRIARQKSIEFKNKLTTALRALETEKGYGHYQGSVEKLYDFMLERDKDNKLTGHILTKFSSALMDAYAVVLDETASLPAEQRIAARITWKNANMPINRENRDDALSLYIGDLVDKGIMSPEESKLYWENSSVGYLYRASNESIMNTEAAGLIDEWHANNSMSFREPINKWKDPNWKKLEGILATKNAMSDYYNLISDEMHTFNRFMPYNKRLYSKLPYITKTTLERLQTGETAKEVGKDIMSKTFQKHTDDLERGELTDEKGNVIDFIPVHYQRNSTFTSDAQSYDLSTLYYMYHRMATNYLEKIEVQAEAELVRTIAENRDYTVRDTKGKPITRILDNVSKKQLTKSGSKALIVDQYSDFLKMVLYGKDRVEEGDLNVFGYKVDKAKALGLLGKYTSYNMLGLNVIQGLSNVNYGELQQIIEGVANEFFSTKDLHESTMEYSKNLFGIVGDIGNRTKVNKVNALNEHFDILNDYEGGEMRKDTRFATLTMSDAMFFTSHAGEHFMQSRVMIAMLNKVKAYDSTGKELGTIYEMYKTNKDGNLVLDERVDLEKSNWTEEESTLYGEKIKRLLARLHGEYSSLGKSSVQRYAVGRMAIMFRKFMVPGFKKRYESKGYNEFLGEYTEGSYREFGSFLKNLSKSLVQMNTSLMAEDWNKLLPREKANVIRALGEVMSLIMLTVLATAFLALRGDDDDDVMYGTLAYVALRGRSEFSFYYNPVEAMKILSSPAASMSTIKNMFTLLGQLLPPEFSGWETYERGSWKDHYKITKTMTNFVPGYRQYYRVSDVGDLLSVFNR